MGLPALPVTLGSLELHALLAVPPSLPVQIVLRTAPLAAPAPLASISPPTPVQRVQVPYQTVLCALMLQPALLAVVGSMSMDQILVQLVLDLCQIVQRVLMLALVPRARQGSLSTGVIHVVRVLLP